MKATLRLRGTAYDPYESSSLESVVFDAAWAFGWRGLPSEPCPERWGDRKFGFVKVWRSGLKRGWEDRQRSISAKMLKMATHATRAGDEHENVRVLRAAAPGYRGGPQT